MTPAFASEDQVMEVNGDQINGDDIARKLETEAQEGHLTPQKTRFRCWKKLNVWRKSTLLFFGVYWFPPTF